MSIIEVIPFWRGRIVDKGTVPLSTSEASDLVLDFDEVSNAGLAHVQEGVQLGAAERGALAGALDLHDAAGVGADQVEVHVGVAVLGICLLYTSKKYQLRVFVAKVCRLPESHGKRHLFAA